MFDRCTFQNQVETQDDIIELLTNNSKELENKITSLLKSMKKNLKFEFDEDIVQGDITNSQFYKLSSGVVQATSLRLTNYLQR